MDQPTTTAPTPIYTPTNTATSSATTSTFHGSTQNWTTSMSEDHWSTTTDSLTSMHTGRILPEVSTAAPPLVSSYQIFSYDGGTCFVETNVMYVSATHADDFAQYFSHSFEKCCSDCNRLAICLSWSYSVENQTCTLKRAFRAMPTLTRDYISGFKPNELYSLSIARGLEFVNLDTDPRINPYTLMAINYPNSTISFMLINDIETQVSNHLGYI